MEFDFGFGIRADNENVPSEYLEAAREQFRSSAQYREARRLVIAEIIVEQNMLARRRTGLLAPISSFMTNARIHIRRRRLRSRIFRLLDSYELEFYEGRFLEDLEDVPTGLEQSVIDSIPLQPVTIADIGEDGEAQCGICLEAVALGELLARIPCGHPFHHKCISSWYKSKSTCPSCRARYSVSAEGENGADEQSNNETVTLVGNDRPAPPASGVASEDGASSEA